MLRFKILNNLIVKKRCILLLLLLISFTVKAQYGSLSEAAEISILTIGPGKNLYDKFGHSAFRVKDSLAGVDVVFNYGGFDFDTPNFYTKFARGKLDYSLGVSYFHDFYNSYVFENRWIREQTLNLTKEEKQAISDFLWKNALPENKYYKYDFFYDNCATKIRDVLQMTLMDQLEYHDDHIQKEYSFRELIRKNLHQNSWGSLGIDIALGAVIDRKASPIEYQFLPEYVYKGAANATIQHGNQKENLVKSEKLIYENTPIKEKRNFLLSPLMIFSVIGLIIIFITFRDSKNKTRSQWLDGIIMIVTGIIGILLFLLWFATDHTATANNYNLLWAFPLSLFFFYALFGRNPSVIVRRYVFFLILLFVLLGIHWLTGVQSFAIGLIPLLIGLVFRYIYTTSYIAKKSGR